MAKSIRPTVSQSSKSGKFSLEPKKSKWRRENVKRRREEGIWGFMCFGVSMDGWMDGWLGDVVLSE